LIRANPYLNAQIWPASTTLEIDEKKFDKYLNTQSYSKVRRGAMGCAISHIRVLEHVIENKLEEVIVFEDDVVLSPDFEMLYKEFRENLPRDGTFAPFLHHDSMKSLRGLSKFTISGNKFVLKSYSPYGTVGYLITLKGAKKVLPTLSPVWYPIDEMYRSATKSGTLTSYMPAKDLIVMPYKMKSNIWSTKKRPKGAKSEICKSFPNFWKDKKLKRHFKELLSYADKVFRSASIEYCISYGTALGFRRMKQLTPWDDDVDLLIRKSNSSSGRSLIKPPYCTEKFWGGWKIFRCDSQNAGKWPWKYPFIDIFDNTDVEGRYRNSGRYEVVFPSVDITFEGMKLKGPKDINKHLSYYGNFLEDCVAPHWDHANEKSRGKFVQHKCKDVMNLCFEEWNNDSKGESSPVSNKASVSCAFVANNPKIAPAASEIDSHDFVVRFNDYWSKKIGKEVWGQKVTHVIINDQKKIQIAPEVKGTVCWIRRESWLPLSLYNPKLHKPFSDIQQDINKFGCKLITKEMYDKASSWIRKHEKNKKWSFRDSKISPTTGFLGVVLLEEECDKMDFYGFSENPNGWPNHRYDTEHEIIQKHLISMQKTIPRRYIYIDMGANWCNTLEHYKVLAPELKTENWEIYAFEAAPYIQPFVDKCVLSKNGAGPMPDNGLPPTGSTHDLSRYASKYNCPKAPSSTMRSCMFKALESELEALYEDERFKKIDFINARLREASVPNSLGRPRFTFVPAAVSGEDGELTLYGNKQATIRGGFRDSPFAGYKKYFVKMVDVVSWIKKSFNNDDFIVIKMDVEGAEHQIIPKLISANVAVYMIAMECHKTRTRSCQSLDKMIKEANIKIMYEGKDYKGFKMKNKLSQLRKEKETKIKCPCTGSVIKDPNKAFVRKQKGCENNNILCSASIYECLDSKLMFTYPIPTKAQLEILYKNSYSGQANLQNGHIRVVTQSKFIREHSNIDLHDKTIVELGCAGGHLLDQFRGHGNELICFEGDPDLHNKFRNNFLSYDSATLVPTLFDGTSLRASSVDLIMSSHVVEHISEPCVFLKEVYTALKPGGFMFHEIPQQRRTDGQHPLNKMQLGEYHMTFWTHESVDYVFKFCGFEKVKLQVFSDYTKVDTNKKGKWIRALYRKPN